MRQHIHFSPSGIFTLSGLLVSLCVSFVGAEPAAATEQPAIDSATLKFFEAEVRPILVEHCSKCHGVSNQEGGLRLDHISQILKGGDRGPAIVPGQPSESSLLTAVSRTDPDFQMPPDEQLSASQVAALTKWIEMGAPWPDGEAVAKLARTPGVITDEDRQWWAFQPVRRPPVPPSGGPHPVDAFLAERLSAAGLKAAPSASREEWVRRVYFDLHGLPPSLAEASAFISDAAPGAEERLIDQLLASPRYGERWAQHWLDIVRYAESDGYRADGFRENAWPYRDYVIRSFNDDKPYDQFVREQLAGDELTPDDPQALIGTAFLRHTVYEWNQRDVVGQWTGIVNEVTDVTADVFLGLSVQCARCHDHKFDPILHKDYYQLQSFFGALAWPEDRVLATAEQRRQHAEQQLVWESATQEITAEIETLIGPPIARAEQRARDIFPEDIKAMFLKPSAERTPREEQLVQIAHRQVALERPKFKDSNLPPDQQEKLKELRDRLAAFDHLKPKDLPQAYIAADVGPAASPTTYKSRRDGEQTVNPSFLTILDAGEATITPPSNGVISTGRRTALAEWITRPTNPLTARVIVNRVWQYHFGRGLSASSSDFGRLGEPPSHPELLDWLASDFMNNDWQLKRLHKQIMMSAAYRRTAQQMPGKSELQTDPENRLLWRFSPRRLDAEQTRDAILALSGELDLKAGGPSVDAWVPRRSIYTKKMRNSPNAFLGCLDAPAGFSSVPARESTTTPIQALLFVNGEWPLSRARTMAHRILKESATDDAALAVSAWQLTLGRSPSLSEQRQATVFLREQRELVSAVRTAPVVFQNPLPDSSAYLGAPSTANLPAKSFLLQPGTPYEKLLVSSPNSSPDDGFTVEALVQLESFTPDSSVRTIASRWNSNKNERGWSLGVTGAKSRFQPGNLILEVSGDDFQSSLLYEVVASGLRIPVGRPYYVSASLDYKPANGKKFGGTVTFHACDLSSPDAPLQSATISHMLCASVKRSDRNLCIGGRDREHRHVWSGAISRVTVRPGPIDLLTASLLGHHPTEFTADRASEMLAAPAEKGWRWDSASSQQPASAQAPLEALTDLCHTLLTSNEFLYLH